MDKQKAVLALASLTVGLLLSVPTLAHHGTNISYDMTKRETASGVVTAYRHANPHSQLFVDIVDIRDENGSVVAWAFEVPPSPFSMSQNGWGRRRAMEALKAGTEVTITFFPSKAGTRVGVAAGISSELEENLLGLVNPLVDCPPEATRADRIDEGAPDPAAARIAYSGRS